jgi:ankyrin repeat protein
MISGWTLLHYACVDKYINCAKTLIESGANVNAKTKYGSSSLIIICGTFNYTRKNGEIIELLLKHGADIYAKDMFHNNAHDILLHAFPLVSDNRRTAISECMSLLIKYMNKKNENKKE